MILMIKLAVKELKIRNSLQTNKQTSREKQRWVYGYLVVDKSTF